MIVREPEAFQLLADETRRKILYLLRVKEMTVSQIAAELDLTSQAVYHHIKKLLTGKMVEVVREERIGHLIESYYRATAEDFILSTGKVSSQTIHDKKLASENVTAILNALKKIGFKLEFDQRKISKLIDLQAGIEDCCTGIGEYDDKIWNLENLSLHARVMAVDFAKLLLMSDAEFSKEQENRKNLRETLLSLMDKQKK